jgi:hypothetical protein
MTDLAEIRARCEAATPGPWIREGAVISSLRGVWYALKTSADRADLSLMFRACEDIPALLAEVERLRADAELGRLVREVLPLMAVEPPANHHTALICWGGSGWDVFYACDDWSLPDTAPSTTPEDALRSARENMEQHRMLVGYYPDFRAAEAQT